MTAPDATPRSVTFTLNADADTYHVLATALARFAAEEHAQGQAVGGSIFRDRVANRAKAMLTEVEDAMDMAEGQAA